MALVIMWRGPCCIQSELTFLGMISTGCVDRLGTFTLSAAALLVLCASTRPWVWLILTVEQIHLCIVPIYSIYSFCLVTKMAQWLNGSGMRQLVAV